MKLTTCLSILTVAFAVQAGENLCINGDLEKGTAGWTFHDDSYRVEPGAGMNGSAAIVFDANNWRKHTGPRYDIAAKPGRVYRFSGYIKRDTVTNGVQIALVRMTKEFKWITQVIAIPMNVNAVDNDGWEYVEAETAFLDEKSQNLRLYIYVRDGACGRFRVDNMRIEEMPEDPLGELQTSAYRDAAASGEVTFAVPIRVNPIERKVDQLKAEFSFVSDAGTKRKVPMTIKDNVAKVMLDVAKFAKGAQSVEATLKDARGEVLDTAAIKFTHLSAEPDAAVWIDGHRRFIVHGKPFFPISFTWGMSIKRSEWAAAMEKLHNGPFNLAMVYEHELSPADLDFFYSHGMMVKYNLKDVYTDTTKVTPPPGVKTEADEIRYVKEKVNLLKDHPGLFAWYTNDEFPPSLAKRVRDRRELLHQLDSGHPVTICLDRPLTVGQFVGGYDVIGSDPYPVGQHDNRLSNATKWTRQTNEQVLGLKPMLQTVQAFDWTWFNVKNARFPTFEEMRSMTWQQIVEGATGISFFSYSCIYANLQGEAFDRALGDTVKVAEEVRKLSPVILSIESAPKVLSAPDGLNYRVWRYDGKVYLIVCDLSGKASTPELQLEGRYRAATCLPGATAQLEGSNRLKLQLPSYGVAIVRLTR